MAKSFGGGASKSSSSSNSTSRAITTPDLTALRGTIGNQLNQYLGAYGPSLFEGDQALNSMFRNMFLDADPGSDYLGARSAIQRGLSPQGLTDNYMQAFSALEPGLGRAMQLSTQGLANAAGPRGLRYSSDLLNIQGRANQDLINQAQQQALGVASQQQQQALQGGLSVLGLLGQAGGGGIGNLLPLLLQYATSFAPVGQDSTSKSNSASFNFNVGAPV